MPVRCSVGRRGIGRPVAVVATLLGALVPGGSPPAAVAASEPAATAVPMAAPGPAGPLALTGLDGPSPGRPALIVKIDNAPRARPQT